MAMLSIAGNPFSRRHFAEGAAGTGGRRRRTGDNGSGRRRGLTPAAPAVSGRNAGLRGRNRRHPARGG